MVCFSFFVLRTNQLTSRKPSLVKVAVFVSAVFLCTSSVGATKAKAKAKARHLLADLVTW